MPMKATPRSCLVLLAISVVVLVVLVGFMVVPQWRANHVYVEHACVVRDKKLVEGQHKGSRTYRPELLIEYTAAGRPYRTWAYSAVTSGSSWKGTQQAELDRFVIGQTYPCWVDPDQPEKAVLVRGYHWLTWLIVPLMALAALASLVGYCRSVANPSKPAA